PFLISTKGYGIFVNSSFETNFDTGKEKPNEFSFTVNNCCLDYFFIFSPDLKKVLQNYTSLTGKSPLPPEWVFGPWMSKNSYISQQEVLEVVSKSKELDIPASAIVLEAWKKQDEWNKFNPETFPQPQNMIEELHKQGLKVILWVVPYWNKEQKTYNDAAQKGYFAKDSGGGPYPKKDWFEGCAVVDFTNPQAVKWWQELHRPLIDIGVDGFKTDGGEGVLPGMFFADGKTGAEMRNLYPVLYNRTMYELVNPALSNNTSSLRSLRRKSGVKESGFLWARSGFAGSQRYPGLWAGDQGAEFMYLRSVIKAGQSAALSGISFWGNDIGGYWGKPSKELYIRWAQFGAFSPLMQFHGMEPHEPWAYDDETVEIYRYYAKLRMALLPYIYKCAKISSETGLPLIRPLVLEYPGDKNTYSQDYEYFFGDSILAAPVCEKGTLEREVYLPEGNWIDFWESASFSGKQKIIYKAGLDRIPLFVKAGSIIPLSAKSGFFSDLANDDTIFAIYPAGESVKFGEIKCVRKGDKIMLETGNDKTYFFCLYTGKPREVLDAAGKVFTEYKSKNEFKNAPSGWWYADERQMLFIRAQFSPGGRVIVNGTEEPVQFSGWDYPVKVVKGEGEIEIKVKIKNARKPFPFLHYKSKSGRLMSVKLEAGKFVFEIPNSPLKKGDTGGFNNEDRLRFYVKDEETGLTSDVKYVQLIPPVNVKVNVDDTTIISGNFQKITLTLDSNSSKDASGSVKVQTPAGWKVKPSSVVECGILPDKRELLYFEIILAQNTNLGEYPLIFETYYGKEKLQNINLKIIKSFSWMVIGPFENKDRNGFDNKYPPEKEVDYRKKYPGKSGEVSWKKLSDGSISPEGYVDIKKNVSPADQSVAYALTNIYSPDEKYVQFRTGSDDTLTLWLNDDLILSKNVYRMAKKDEDIVKVKLKKGKNKLLVKVCNGEGDCGFYFRITDLDGNEMTDVYSRTD
ncbi:MAG: glycoside hydrolase family 31 protein, partial [Elusimicrobiota bacterium]